MSKTGNNGKRVVLVTGASSGIGRSIAGLFSEKGLKVYGTSREPRRESGNAAGNAAAAGPPGK